MRIGVDWDGTIADTTELVLALVNFRKGEHYTKEDDDAWDFWKREGLDIEFWAVYNLMDRLHLRRAIRPLSPFAPAGIKWLVQRGHSVDVLTGNNERAQEDIRAWNFGHGLDVRVRTMGRGHHAEERTSMEYDLFIDDNPHMVEAIVGHPSKFLILVDEPWNQYVTDLPRNVVRMRDWKDAPSIFEVLHL